MSLKERIVKYLELPDALIARNIGCTREYVRQVRNAVGAPSSPYKHSRLAKCVFTEDILTNILKSYMHTNKSLFSIAKEVGVDPVTARSALIRVGAFIPGRPFKYVSKTKKRGFALWPKDKLRTMSSLTKKKGEENEDDILERCGIRTDRSNLLS